MWKATSPKRRKKLQKKHLLPQALESLQLPFSLKVSPAATEFLIEKYTRESGVRQLEKQIAKLVRKIVLNYQISDEVQQKAMANKTLKPADDARDYGELLPIIATLIKVMILPVW